MTGAIDGMPVTVLQATVIALCSTVAFLDGMDSQSIALAAPLIGDAFDVPRAALGTVFSAQILGAMVGAFCFGALGDRFGRKRMLVLASVVFGALTSATAYAPSFNMLLATRFLAGVGLGGAMPSFIALATEYAPRHRRATVATLIWAAFPLGGSIGGFANGALLAAYGWQAVFKVGGLLPLVLSFVLAAVLPKSTCSMPSREASPTRIAAVARRFRPGAALAARVLSYVRPSPNGQLARLLYGRHLQTTLLLWAVFFLAFGVLGIAVVWTPMLMRGNDLAPAHAGTALGVHGIGALAGMAIAGRLMERFGAAPVLVPALLLGALATGTLGHAAASLVTVSIVLFLVGAFVGIGASGAIALAASYYPADLGSSGVGAAMAMGRFGQMVAPLLATSSVAMGWSGGRLFMLFGFAPALAALMVLMLPSEVTPKDR